MPSNVDALNAFLVLLPGFLCARIVQSLCVRTEQTELDKVVEAFIYSFVIYVLYRVTVGPIHDAGGRLLLLICYSILVGIFLSAASTNDWFGRFFRMCRITHRTSNTSIWNDVFHNLGGYLLVELGDGKLVVGWVRYFSDRSEDSSLFLEDAAWIDRQTGAQTEIDGAGILIGHECDIRTISFLTGRHISSTEETRRK